MSKMFGFFFALMFIVGLSPAYADIRLPVISARALNPGRSWTWDYFQADGRIYSTERYTILSRVGSVVLIEIASDYGGSQNLKPNTRLEVDVDQCLAAYAKPNEKTGWSFKMYSLSGSLWSPYEPRNTLAFEEKFNCNPRSYQGVTDRYLTVYSTIHGQRVFQQKLWRRLSSSWFAQEGVSAGIAIQKDFASDPTQIYRFQLRLNQN